MREGERGAEVGQQEMVLLVVGEYVPGLRVPFRISHDLGLYLPGLYFLFPFVEGCSHKEVIRPPLVSHAHLHLSEEGEIVVMEPPSVNSHIFAAFLVPHFNPFHHEVVFHGRMPGL